MQRRGFLWGLAVLLATANAGAADDVRETLRLEGGPVLFRGVIARTATPTMTAIDLDADLHETATKTVLFKGEAARFAVATRENAVAFVTAGPNGVRVAVAARADHKVVLSTAKRKADPAFSPARAIICADPGGFAVLWQEWSTKSGPADVRSFFGLVAADGTWRKEPVGVDVPWGFGAMVWTGDGYHLGLFFDGGAATRLALVGLSKDGAPQQHPGWFSPAEGASDVTLLRIGDATHAVYRNESGDLRTVSAKDVGSWGKEPPASIAAGAIGAATAFAIRAKDGAVEVVKMP